MISAYSQFIKYKFLDKDVHVVGSGPSLYGFDYSYFDGKNVISTNHAHKLLKNSINVFVDKSFPTREDSTILNTTCMTFNHHKLDVSYSFPRSNYFSFNPENGVYTTKSSGAAALTIALQSGARCVYIHGLDCTGFTVEQMAEIASTNNVAPPKEFTVHSTSGIFQHSKDNVSDSSRFRQTIDLFKVFPKYKVKNCSQFSAIPYFEKVGLP